MAWQIYKHTNKSNGKAYIGLTKHSDPNKRWLNGAGYSPLFPFGRAIDKYGWDNFEHEIIESDIQTLEEANTREQYWISFYHAYVGDAECHGYNATPGGDSRENLGKPIYQLEPDTFFIVQRWSSINTAANELGIDHRSIQRVCIGEYRHAGGFCWCFEEEYSPNWQIREDHDKMAVIDLSNNVEYISINEASRVTGICNSSIGRVCRGEQQFAGGRKWKYKYMSDEEVQNRVVQRRESGENLRPVCCYEDKKEFVSVAEAARFYELDLSAVTKCCKGKLKKSGGKTFYYKGDTPNLEQATYGAKPCMCIDTGKIYSSCSEAARVTNICQNSISKCCNLKQKTAGHQQWRFLTEEEKKYYYNNYIVDYTKASIKNKPVRCIETNVVYSSAIVAEKETGIDADSIRKCCNHNYKVAGGFTWEYTNKENSL